MKNYQTNDSMTTTLCVEERDSVVNNNVEPVIQTLVLSVILLLVVSTIKYHVDKKNEGKDYWNFFLEFPIDLGLVFISLFVSYYYLVSNINWLLIIAFFEVFVIIIGSICRRCAQDKFLSTDTKIKVLSILGLLALEFLIIVAPATISLLVFVL